MDTVILGSALLMGLVGNLHCVGMCGPIALAIPFKNGSKFSRLLSILTYNFGRVLVYSGIGIIFGLLGKGVELIGFQQYLSIIIGVLIILAVLVPFLFKKINLLNSSLFSWVGSLKSAFRKRFEKKSYRSLFILGVLNGFLPCGLVYMAAAGSVIAGSWYMGAFYMALFGIGTLPAMVLLPYFSNYIKTPFQLKLKKLVPVFMIVMGGYFIVRGANLGIPYLSPKVVVENTGCNLKCH